MRSLIVLMACCWALSASAHDFWMQPTEFWVQPEVVTPLTIQVGHGPDRQLSPIPAKRIIRFEAVTPNGAVIEVRDRNLRLKEPGAYVVVLETDGNAQSYQPASRFNDYLKAEGLLTAQAQRAQTNRMDVDGAERYSRVAKSIVQVGAARAGSQSRVTRPLGLPLEIVPEQDPYAEPRAQTLSVRVIYEGKPLPSALVKLTDLDHDASPLATQTTDKQGRASFTMPRNGSWLLNVVWTKALPASSDTDFETIFSSLSFGFASTH